MAREKGPLVRCLEKASHHLSVSTIKLMFHSGASIEEFEYRLKLVREEIEIAEEKVQRIQQVAQQKNYQDILAILNEEIEFGHDFISPVEGPQEIFVK